MTKSKLREQCATSSAISGSSSGIVAIRASATPILRSSRAAKYAFESCTLPERISLPTTTSAQLRSRIWIDALRGPPRAYYRAVRLSAALGRGSKRGEDSDRYARGGIAPGAWGDPCTQCPFNRQG